MKGQIKEKLITNDSVEDSKNSLPTEVKREVSSVHGILVRAEKAISEVITVAKAGAKVGGVIVYHIVSCSRNGISTVKHR